MSGGHRIRAIGPEAAQEAPGEASAEAAPDALLLEQELDDEWYAEPDAEARQRSWSWLVPALALLGIAAWTGFFGWTYRAQMLAGAAPDQWIAWTATWAAPTLIILAAWLLTTRNSSREADRFASVAQSLAGKSAALEDRLKTVNRELSLAREFLAAQSRELEALGRIASERLSTHASELQSLVMTNSQQVDAIATVSTTALENMGRLRDDLPVLANSARDVANQIGTAGRTAHNQVAELIAGFERLNHFGRASEAQVETIRTRIADALSTLEAQTGSIDRLTDERFTALRQMIEDFRTELDGREVDALAALRRRSEALASEVASTGSSLAHHEEQALASLQSRLASLREECSTVATALTDGEAAALQGLETRISMLHQRLVDAIGEIQSIDQQALESANRKLEALRLEAEDVDRRIVERDERLHAQIAARQQAIAADEDAAAKALTERLAQVDAEITRRNEVQRSAFAALDATSAAIASQIETMHARTAELAELAAQAQQSVARNADALGGNLERSRSFMADTDKAVANLTEASVRLLELIQASSQHSREKLPEAIAVAETRLADLHGQTMAMDGLIGAARDKAHDLSGYVIGTQAQSREAMAEVEQLRTRISASHAQTHELLVELRRDVAALDEASSLLSTKAQGQLREALGALDAAVRQAPATLEQSVAGSIGVIAARLGAEAGAALDRSIAEAAREALVEFEQTTSKAGEAGREVARMLRDQLAKVSELASHLENRVAQARERAEEQVGNDFARRMALITESLHSNAIDIGKALSSDIADTAWASYLRGDRGIFTRRAVRLLDNTEAREIAEIYDRDDHFREAVSRYIHDFEAMLRSVLSTRDGNALGVTLLSSDMGKLYVVLAQAIERLRD